MALFLTQLMNGIGNGAVYASLALALVLDLPHDRAS